MAMLNITLKWQHQVPGIQNKQTQEHSAMRTALTNNKTVHYNMNTEWIHQYTTNEILTANGSLPHKLNNLFDR